MSGLMVRMNLVVTVSAGVVALSLAASALAENYQFAKTRADVQLARRTVLTRADLPKASLVRGGFIKPDESASSAADSCNGRNPKESDLVVTGDAASRFVDPSGVLAIYSQSTVFKDGRMAVADVTRGLPFMNATCLRHAMEQSNTTHFVSFKRLASLPGYLNASYVLNFTRQTPGQGSVGFLMAVSVIEHGRTEVLVMTQLEEAGPAPLTLLLKVQSSALLGVSRRM